MHNDKILAFNSMYFFIKNLMIKFDDNIWVRTGLKLQTNKKQIKIVTKQKNT